MEKILVLSAHPPLSKSKEAGQKVFYEFLKKISQNFKVYLLTFIRNEEYGWGFEDCKKICEEVHEVEIGFKEKLYNVIKNPFNPPLFSARESERFVYKLKELINNNNFNFVHFEWEQMFQYYNYVKHIEKKTITCHDVISQMYERKYKENNLFKAIYYIHTKETVKLEKRYLPKFNTVFTLNSKDSNLLKTIEKNITVKEVHPHFNKNDYFFEANKKKYDLVFFGAMNRIENEKAILWFLKKVYPQLKRARTDINLIIIGNNPSEKLKRMQMNDESLKVTGFVDDPYLLISQARVGIIPLFLGAGIKIKTLEFMSSGIPIVTTEVGIEGINASQNEGVYIENTSFGFVNSILYLLNNPKIAEKKGLEAKNFITSTYMPHYNDKVISDVYIQKQNE